MRHAMPKSAVNEQNLIAPCRPIRSLDFTRSKGVTMLLLLTLFSPLGISAPFDGITVPAVNGADSPILIQAAMAVEASALIAELSGSSIEKEGPYVFYQGTISGYPVIIGQTGKGMENSAAATAIAILRYRPRLIINQGTSGAHLSQLNTGDIVLGKKVVNIGSWYTPIRAAGAGISPESWLPMDLIESEGGFEDTGLKMRGRYIEASSDIYYIAQSLKDSYRHGDIIEGVIGSGNFWNNEIDRIAWLAKNLGTSTEEMEGAAAAQIAHSFATPFMGIRVISNNIISGKPFDPESALFCQEYVLSIVKKYISEIVFLEAASGEKK